MNPSSLSIRVAVAGPHPERPGGVGALLQLLRGRPELQPVSWIGVGRRDARDFFAPSRDLRAIRRLRGRVDLLHLNPSLRPRALVRDLSLLAAWGGPAVLWVHGWDARVERVFLEVERAGELLRRALRRTRIAVLSPSFRDRWVALGLPAEQIDLVPPAWTGEPHARAPQPRTLLYLGRLVPGKGIDRLLRAAHLLPDVRVVLAGDGPLAGPSQILAKRLGGLPVRQTGWLSDTQKWAALAEAEILVLPSDAEGVPVSLIEGLAAGIPVVASAVGGVPWLLEDGAAGVLLRHQDPSALAEVLGDLLGDPARREALSRRGRQRAAGLSAEALVARLQQVWLRALA